MTESATCRRCGLTSILTQHFWRGRCPSCQSERVPLAQVLLALAFALVLGAVLVYAVLWRGFRPEGYVWPALIAIYGLAPARMLVHEGGHFATARLLGWPVPEVRIGGGEPCFTIPIGQTRWSFGRRMFRGGGSCQALPGPNLTRRAAMLFVGAGSFAELAAAVVLVPFVSASFVGKVLGLFAFMCMVDVLSSLIPMKKTGADGRPNDGMHLLRLLRAPERVLAEWRLAAPMYRAIEFIKAGQQAEAIAFVDEVAPHLPNDQRTRGTLASLHHLCGRPELALAQVEDLAAVTVTRGFVGDQAVAYLRGSLLVALDRFDEVIEIAERQRAAAADDELRARWSGLLALALLMRGQDEESVTRAAEEAEYAFARLPWVPYVLTSWGMALIEQGQHENGLQLFDLGDKHHPTLTSLRDAWRVVAYAACGRRAEADETLRRLREADPWPAALRRAEAAT